MTDSRSLDSLTATDFQGIQPARFRVTGEPVSPEIELVNVSEFPGSGDTAFRKPFSVLFHGPLDTVLPQGIHRLEHEHLGALELFMVPVGPDEAATAMRYEAVFG
jgi:hypothetical protein